MPEINLLAITFEHRGIDAVFTLVRVLTMCTYVVWPVVVFVGIMALGGKPVLGKSRLGELVTTVLFFILMFYPALFMSWVGFAEKYIAPYFYAIGVIVALLPSLLFTGGIGLMLMRRSASRKHPPRDNIDD